MENQLKQRHNTGAKQSKSSENSPTQAETPTSFKVSPSLSSFKLKNSPLSTNLHFAPLDTPMESRLQTVGIIWHTISIPFFFLLLLFVLYLGWVAWVVIILPYFIWWYGFDLHTPSNGRGQYRYREWMRNLIIWEWFVNYFPINVHKSCELEPTFQKVVVEEKMESSDDDEQDLVSEDSRTIIDAIFRKLGLSKRLNVIENSKNKEGKKVKNISVGPRYIFGYHPHGVISMGVMGTFATNALQNVPFEPVLSILKPLFHDTTGKKPLFPGLGRIFPMTLTTQFVLPFYRDYLMSLGLTSAAARNIRSLIKNGDNSVVIVVGGAQESLLNDQVVSQNHIGKGYKENNQDKSKYQKIKEDNLETKNEDSGNGNSDKNMDTIEGKVKSVNQSQNQNTIQDFSSTEDGTHSGDKSTTHSKEIRLVLNKRKGFVKIAIELGNVSLVPIFAFGEADIYNVTIPKKGSLGYMFQHWMKKVFSFTLPFFSARGVFIYDFGFLPYRNPINLCMGRPIHIPAGAVEDYKAKHPESVVEDKLKATSLENPKSSRNNSFSSLFKLNSSHKPKKSSSQAVPAPLLDKYHKLYVDELKRVYEENKDKFGYGDVRLNIIE